MDREEIRKIVEKVLEKKGLYGGTGGRESCPGAQQAEGPAIPVEVSARHVHLTQEALDTLFGPRAGLTEKRALSQPGEFLSEERVRLIGPKGDIGNVAILGPLRKAVQAEISLTDARILGVEAPLRLSGNLSGAADLYIAGPAGVLHAKGAAIVAKNHIHLRPQDAKALGVLDGASVRVRVNTERPLVFEDVAVRVRETFMPAMHIDFDEANACMPGTGTRAEILAACGAEERQTAGRGGPLGEASSPETAQRPPALPASKSQKLLVTEAEAKRLVAGPGGTLSFPKGTIVTPAAKDVFSYAGCPVKFV
ncbi:MAG: phosphate propanoyltransferase [Treponema sp.]|nr:phosphate propanoyltransferase [Treponema sp.]